MRSSIRPSRTPHDSGRNGSQFGQPIEDTGAAENGAGPRIGRIDQLNTEKQGQRPGFQESNDCPWETQGNLSARPGIEQVGQVPPKHPDLSPPLSTYPKRSFVMKKKSRIEVAREIIANLRREMDRPRLTESVRQGLSGAAPLAAAPSTGFKRSSGGQSLSS